VCTKTHQRTPSRIAILALPEHSSIPLATHVAGVHNSVFVDKNFEILDQLKIEVLDSRVSYAVV